MTQEEIEAKLESLTDQLSQLRGQQENRNKIWLLLGILSLFLGVGFVITGSIVVILIGSMIGNALMLTGTPLMFLALALFAGADKIAMAKAATSGARPTIKV